MKQIKGKFGVKSTPLEADLLSKELGLLRMRFDKKFEGPLTATSFVSMMGMMDQSIGSGAYVALEKVTGELGSLKGSFYLMHSSSMAKGVPKQSVSVVPDSGKDGFAGITGEMIINIVKGEHFYTFNYEL